EDASIASEHVISEALPTVVFVARSDETIEYVNRRWAELTGIEPDRDVTEAWTALQHPDDRARIASRWKRSVLTGEDFEAELRIRIRDNSYRWHLMTAAGRLDPHGCGLRWYGTLIDIHERKRLESTQRFLAAAAKTLTASLDPAATVRAIAALAIPDLADFCDVSLVRDARLRSVASAAVQPPRTIWIRELLARHPSLALNREFGPGRALRTGEPEMLGGLPPGLARQLLAEGEEAKLLREAATQSVLIVPMIARGATIGVMTLAFADETRRYKEEDLAVARDLASRASIAIENAEAYEAQRELAAELQHALLPTDVPILDDVVISTYYQPAESASSIGGDWYDAFRIDAHRLAFAVGDVAGHGTQAAMVMGEMRQVMRGGLLEGETPLGALRRANRHLLTHRHDIHVTALLAVLDTRTHVLAYANAGHPPLIIRHPDGTLAEFGPHGFPLGIGAELDPGATEVSLPPGSGIVFYTDGLIETHADVLAGLRVLKAVVGELPRFDRTSAGEIAARVLQNRTHQDDVAVMTVLAAH
ncbi:MAG TPA: SpoIIE family protein phosphatase, partial [Candidatus Limnocylindria bacterium]|nr:SpoIIE family protein phosphatase [Candidatus Limnocylindria bacterium]